MTSSQQIFLGRIGSCGQAGDSKSYFRVLNHLDSVLTRLSGILFCSMIRLSLPASGEHTLIAVHRRRDISDSIREKLEPRLPGREGRWGGGARDNRRLVNAVFRVMRAGAPWRDSPPDFGG